MDLTLLDPVALETAKQHTHTKHGTYMKIWRIMSTPELAKGKELAVKHGPKLLDDWAKDAQLNLEGRTGKGSCHHTVQW